MRNNMKFTIPKIKCINVSTFMSCTCGLLVGWGHGTD